VTIYSLDYGTVTSNSLDDGMLTSRLDDIMVTSYSLGDGMTQPK
jgi:hypothetical protein